MRFQICSVDRNLGLGRVDGQCWQNESSTTLKMTSDVMRGFIAMNCERYIHICTSKLKQDVFRQVDATADDSTAIAIGITALHRHDINQILNSGKSVFPLTRTNQTHRCLLYLQSANNFMR